MRRIALVSAVALIMVPLSGFAQSTPGSGTGGPPTVGTAPPTRALDTPPAPGAGTTPQPGDPLLPGTPTGRDVVASDGISTRTVKAAPCGKAARETDGTTTCVGIPDASRRRH
jgi:hypothetical protein